MLMCIKYKSKFVYVRLKDLIEKLPVFDIFPIMIYRILCKSKILKVLVTEYFLRSLYLTLKPCSSYLLLFSPLWAGMM